MRFREVPLSSNAGAGAPLEPIDPIDRQIMECLREDGRMSSSMIASRIGVSDKTVRRKLKRMEQVHGLKLVPVIDPDKIGLDTCLFVGISVDKHRLEETAAAVRALPEVRYVAITTGPWDLLIEAFVGSRDHMATFLINTLGHLDGVRDIDTFNVIRIVKFGYEWEVPAVVRGATPRVSIAHPERDRRNPRPGTPRR
ncbi:MAG: Lrp/AsnC family transcriptional regulator [Rhodococcus sp. (in: high G+C Gram-positive bacteria)]